jgi:hypothetical protein
MQSDLNASRPGLARTVMTKEFAQLLVAQAPRQIPHMHPVHRRPPFLID